MIISIVISFISLLLSIGAIFLTCSNILKNDERAKLAINWETYIEKGNINYQKAKVKVKDYILEVQIPQLRIYVNSGSIQRTYMLFPYPFEGTEECQYRRFEATHIRLGRLVNTKKWWPIRERMVSCVPTQFEALCPEENGGSTYLMYLVLGNDSSYHLIMLVYKNILSGVATLETFDKIDCLTYKEANNHTYIKQFHRCIDYLKDNGIEVI